MSLVDGPEGPGGSDVYYMCPFPHKDLSVPFPLGQATPHTYAMWYVTDSRSGCGELNWVPQGPSLPNVVLTEGSYSTQDV